MTRDESTFSSLFTFWSRLIANCPNYRDIFVTDEHSGKTECSAIGTTRPHAGVTADSPRSSHSEIGGESVLDTYPS